VSLVLQVESLGRTISMQQHVDDSDIPTMRSLEISARYVGIISPSRAVSFKEEAISCDHSICCPAMMQLCRSVLQAAGD
jgi:hypothetical protein